MADKEPLMPYELSEAKLAANRRNALKSTGPRTPRGKYWSSRNALKHGGWSKLGTPPVPEEVAAFRQRCAAELQPLTPLQHRLVDQLALAGWRVRQAHALMEETALHDPQVPYSSGLALFREIRRREDHLSLLLALARSEMRNEANLSFLFSISAYLGAAFEVRKVY